jgi:uncharacterized protein (DUF736 family)
MDRGGIVPMLTLSRDAGAVRPGSGHALAAHLYARVSFPSPDEPGLLCGPFDIRHLFSSMLSDGANHVASDGLIWPKDGCASIACAATADGSTFFPWASPIPREARKSHRRHPPLRSGPKTGASSLAFGLQIAIEAAMVAGSKQPRRSDMANIGTFKKSGHEFQGEIVTLSVQTKGVRIVPEANRASDNAPSHRVYVGRVEIGAAWSKRSSEGRDYLSVKLDDPSFTAPIYANLVEDDGETFTLIWSRSRKQNGD